MVSESYSNFAGTTDNGREWSNMDDNDSEFTNVTNDILPDDDELAMSRAEEQDGSVENQAEVAEQSEGQRMRSELATVMARVSIDGERPYRRSGRGVDIEDEAKERGLSLEDYYTSGSPEDRQKVLECFALKCFKQDGSLNFVEASNFSRKYRNLWEELGRTAMFEDIDMSIEQARELYEATRQAAIYENKAFDAGEAVADTFSGLNSSEYATILAVKNAETTNNDILEVTEGLLVSRLDDQDGAPLTRSNIEMLLRIDNARKEGKYPEELRARIREEATANNYFDVMTAHYDEFSTELLGKATDTSLSPENQMDLYENVMRIYLNQKSNVEKLRENGEDAEIPSELNQTLLLALAHQEGSWGSLVSFDTPELRTSYDELRDAGSFDDASAVGLARKFYTIDVNREQNTDWAAGQLLASKDYGFILSQGTAISQDVCQAATVGIRTLLESEEISDEKTRALKDVQEFYKARYYWDNRQGNPQFFNDAMSEARRVVVASGDYGFMINHIEQFHDDAVVGLLDKVSQFDENTSDEEKLEARKNIESAAAKIGRNGNLSKEAEGRVIHALFELGSARTILSYSSVLYHPASVDAALNEFQKQADGTSEMSEAETERIISYLYKESMRKNSLLAEDKMRLGVAIVEGGMLSAIAENGTNSFDDEQLSRILSTFEQRWSEMTPDEKQAQMHNVSGSFKVISKLRNRGNEGNAMIEGLARKVSELGDYETISNNPGFFSEKDIAGLIELSKSDNEEDRARASECLMMLYMHLDKEKPNDSYSAESIELARQAVMENKQYVYMLRNYQHFPEFIEQVKEQSLDKEMLVALSGINDEEALSKLTFSQRQAAALLRVAGSNSRLGELLAERREGEENAYYEKLFTRGAESAELIDSMLSSSSGEMRRFAPMVIERAILAERDDPQGYTTVEKYLSDERSFFVSDIPHYLKLTKSAIYYDISMGSRFAKTGTSVMSSIENYEQAREMIGGDLLRSAMHSNSRSLKSFLERAAKGELEEGQEMYLQQVLGDASRIEGVPIGGPMELLQRMSSYVSERDKANRAAVIRIDGEPPKYRMATPFVGSDLKKGVQRQQYLDLLFSDGFNAPEMLGADASSDVTNYDADMATSRQSTLDKEASGQEVSLDEQLRDSISESYGTTKVIMRHDARFQDTKHGEPAAYDPTKYEAFDRSSTDFCGIRTGFGALDVDAFAVIGPDSSDVPRLKFEIAKSGCYIPIIDRKTEDVIFTPEDFDQMRARFSGLSQYGNASYEGGSFETDLDEYHFGERLVIPASVTEGVKTQSFDELMAGFEDKKRETVEAQNAVVMSFMDLVRNSDLPDSFKQHFEMMGSSLNEQYSENASLFSTGSTGRLANVPHDGDYDFMLLLDKQDYDAVSAQLAQAMIGEYGGSSVSKGWETGIRGGKLTVNGEELDLDVSIMQKTDQIATSTDSMLAERYRVMEAQDPEAYKQVIANVIIAKALMKNAGCYKKAGSVGAVKDQGGIGGIGVENWILQSGGSLYDAMKSFVETSEQAIASTNDKYRAFKLFKVNYPIFDMGQNFQSKRYREQEYPYDDLTEGDRTSTGRFEIGGWEKMLEVCRETIAKYEASN